MQAKFNRPIIIGGKTYTKGQHEVPAADAKGWFWDALVADGGIVVLRDAAPAPVKVPEPTPEPAPEPQTEEKPKRRKKE